MLGQGLGALIPQKDGQSDADNNTPVNGGAGSTPAWKPQQPAQSNASDGNPPPLELPVLNDEPELPAAPEELELPSGNNIEEEKKEQMTPPNLPSERGGNGISSAFSLKSTSAPVVNPLAGSSISIAARNVSVGSPSAAASLLGQKNVAKPQSGPAVAGTVFHIETDKIVPNPSQPRRYFDESALKDLAYSIREFGILQPLVITKRRRETPSGLDVEYELIAGERRLMAAKLLGLKTVPAIVRDVDLEREKLELAVIENLQREDLSPIETARAFERLRDEFRMTQREIAVKLGKSREVVANTTRLLDLPTYAQDALEKGEISESNARFLLSVDDQEAQRKLFDDIIQHGLTTRDVKERVAVFGKKRGRPKGSGVQPITPELRAIEAELSSELGAPVEIEKKANTGKIMITFYSQEELENILNKLKDNT